MVDYISKFVKDHHHDKYKINKIQSLSEWNGSGKLIFLAPERPLQRIPKQKLEVNQMENILVENYESELKNALKKSPSSRCFIIDSVDIEIWVPLFQNKRYEHELPAPVIDGTTIPTIPVYFSMGESSPAYYCMREDFNVVFK